MTESTVPTPLTLTSRINQMFPALTPSQVARLGAHGRRRAIRVGEILINAGDDEPPFFVVPKPKSWGSKAIIILST